MTRVFLEVKILQSSDMRSTKIQVGKDQEKVHSENDSHSKNRGGKNQYHNYSKDNGHSTVYTLAMLYTSCKCQESCYI